MLPLNFVILSSPEIGHKWITLFKKTRIYACPLLPHIPGDMLMFPNERTLALESAANICMTFTFAFSCLALKCAQ